MTEGVICGLFILLDQVACSLIKEKWHLRHFWSVTKELHLEKHNHWPTHPIYGYFFSQDALKPSYKTNPSPSAWYEDYMWCNRLKIVEIATADIKLNGFGEFLWFFIVSISRINCIGIIWHLFNWRKLRIWARLKVNCWRLINWFDLNLVYSFKTPKNALRMVFKR